MSSSKFYEMSDFHKIFELLSGEKKKQNEINSKQEVLNKELKAVTFYMINKFYRNRIKKLNFFQLKEFESDKWAFNSIRW